MSNDILCANCLHDVQSHTFTMDLFNGGKIESQGCRKRGCECTGYKRAEQMTLNEAVDQKRTIWIRAVDPGVEDVYGHPIDRQTRCENGHPSATYEWRERNLKISQKGSYVVMLCDECSKVQEDGYSSIVLAIAKEKK